MPVHRFGDVPLRSNREVDMLELVSRDPAGRRQRLHGKHRRLRVRKRRLRLPEREVGLQLSLKA